MSWRDGGEAPAQLNDALLVTTLRYDPQLESSNVNPAVAGQPTGFYMITYHHRRLLEAAEHLGFDKAVSALGNVRDFHDAVRNGLDGAADSAERGLNQVLRVLFSPIEWPPLHAIRRQSQMLTLSMLGASYSQPRGQSRYKPSDGPSHFYLHSISKMLDRL